MIRIPRLPVLPLLVLAAFAANGPLHATQSPDLRAENERLRALLADAETELEAARGRITELEASVRSLQEALELAQAGRPSPVLPPTAAPVEDGPVSIDERVREASPRSVQRFAADRLDALLQQVGDLEDVDPDTRARGLQQVRTWVEQTNARDTVRVRWAVRVKNLRRTNGSPEVELQAVDPVTGTKLGEVFIGRLRDELAVRSLMSLLERPGRDPALPLELRGVLRHRVVFNERRPDPGLFDHPVLLGPYCEWGFVVDVQSITARRPEPDDRATASPDAREPRGR